MTLPQKTSAKWIIGFSPVAMKNLKGLDKPVRVSILKYFSQKLETEEDPRRFGKPLSGNLKAFWRYKIGDYRAICEIKDGDCHIIMMRIAHRREVYKRIHLISSSFS